MRIPCKGNIVEAGGYVSISRAQSWHQTYLLHGLWPKNYDIAKLKYIQKVTILFAYDEDTKACKKRLDIFAISTAGFYDKNHYDVNHHLDCFTHVNPNNCAVCDAAVGIL